MNSQHKTVVGAIASLALIGAVALALLTTPSLWPWRPTHNSVRDLEVLPLGPVLLEGVVTYVDSSNRRFWLQDATGAIAINGVKDDTVVPGQEVLIHATKGHSFDPVAGLSSVQLEVSSIKVLKAHVALPQPAPATVKTLPDKDKNGIRVTVAGVLHHVTDRSDGLKLLYFGESGDEIQAVVPTAIGDLTPWINSRLQVTGVSDAVLDGGGSVRSRYIWVAGAGDVHNIGHADLANRVESVRSLYRLRETNDGYQVLMRGVVSAQDAPTILLVEDEFGTVACNFDTPVSVKSGTPVEVVGYAVRNGVRIDLLHTQVRLQRLLRFIR
jgi:hypothetical protein